MPPWEIVTLISVLSVFFSPAVIVAIVLRHRERMQALKNKQEGAPALVAEMRRLHAELTELRETTTRYDMSFDAALQRVEQRIEQVEQAPTASNYGYGSRQTTVEEPTATLRRSV